MAKFNVVQRQRRDQKAERRRAVHGDPASRKLKAKRQPLSVSGKRKRKLLKKWRREQKESIEKGLVSMEDIEMIAADGAGPSDDSKKVKFNVKKSVKLKKGKRKGKNEASKPASQSTTNTMIEWRPADIVMH